MIIDGFSVKNSKVKTFYYTINEKILLSILLTTLFTSSNLWHIFSTSGISLTNGKDIYSLIDSLKLPNESSGTFQHSIQILTDKIRHLPSL